MTISKYIYRSFYLILLFCIFSGYTSHAQSSLFRNYTVKDGLPSSEVYNVMQDSKGYMWFSTDHGVARFDGYTFKNFTTADGLADNTIFECIEDYKGRIWFRSFSGRLSYYYHDSIYRLPINDTIVKLLKRSIPLSLAVSKSDIVYMGAHGFPGIIKIELRNKCKISVISLPKNISYIGIIDSATLMSGNTDNNYVPYSTTYPYIFLHPIDSVSLAIFNVNDGTIKMHKLLHHETDHRRIHDRVFRLNRHQIAASVNSSFLIFNNDSLAFSYIFKKYLLTINPDRNGGAWITLNMDAPAYYYKGKVTFPPMLQFFKQKNVTSIAIDNEGGAWFSTFNNGVYYINSLNFKTLSAENGMAGNKVNYIAIAPDSSVWVSTELTNTITILHKDSIHYLKLPDLMAGLSINQILFNTDKSAWITTTRSLFIYPYFNSPKILTPFFNGMECMAPDTANTVWINTTSTINLFYRVNNSLRLIKTFDLKTKVLTICKGANGDLWVGTLTGLWQIKNDSTIYYGNYSASLRKRINNIKCSTNGDLWIATNDNGVIVKHHDSILHITTEEGLLSNFCQCIFIDYRNNVWVGSNKGLSRIIFSNTSSGALHIDSIKNMTNPELSEVNYITGLKNTLYVATNNGLTSFNTDKVKSNSIPPPVYITQIKINNTPFHCTPATVTLPYNKNYIVFNYIGLTYKDAGNTTYRYKMKGIDTGWIYTKNRDVQYPQLSPGNYTFLVSAMNNDGIWSTSPASFHFIITPPFWQTWWARSLAALLIIGFIYWRIKVIEKREKRKTETNKQLATMELRELKAQIDPHFLFNNFNTLTHLTETKSDDAPEFVSELSKFYRYSLQFRNREFIELENEVKQAERYIHLLKIRFGDSLKVHWQVDNKYIHYFIATYSLQLLFENITKHNVVSLTKPLNVEVMSSDKDILIIKNQLQHKNSTSTSNGIGLKSINQRYLLLTSKKINIIKTSEYFSVELPLIKPSDYEGINY